MLGEESKEPQSLPVILLNSFRAKRWWFTGSSAFTSREQAANFPANREAGRRHSIFSGNFAVSQLWEGTLIALDGDYKGFFTVPKMSSPGIEL